MIKKLWIKQFRNLSETVIELEEGKNVLILGQNNQGKTNFLEAVSVVFSGKSPLEKDFNCFIPFSGTESVVGTLVDDGIKTEKIFVKVTDAGVSGFYDQKPFKSYVGLKKRFPVVFFSSDFVHTFRESPAERRHQIDEFCSAFFPEYSSLFIKFEKAVKQKNKLLKENPDKSLVEFWNVTLADLSSKLVNFRLKGLIVLQDEYSRIMDNFNSKIPKKLHINYQFSGAESVDKYQDTLLKKLGENIEKEIYAGYCLYGAHRDDYSLIADDKNLFQFYSRGVNKSVAFILKIAQFNCISRLTGLFPILLLDDSFSEVDDSLKTLVLSRILDKGQVFYSTILESDKHIFKDFMCFNIENGVLTRG